MGAKDRWSLRNIYLYVVCLITLIMAIFATVGLVRNAVELLYPDPGYFVSAPVPDGGDPEAAEEQHALEQKYQQRQSRRSAILGLVGNVAMLAVAGPLYLYHWRRIEKDIAEDGSRTAEIAA